jgi:hypothetical protein
MGASAWIKFAVAYHKKHGGKYSDSLKKAAPLWRAQKGKGKSSEAAEVKKKPKRRRRAKKK